MGIKSNAPDQKKANNLGNSLPGQSSPGQNSPGQNSPGQNSPGRAVTVIMPCHNEADNIPILIDEITSAFEGQDFEIIVVDDGSTDDTGGQLALLSKANCHLRVIRHVKSAGQSAAILTGMLNARARYIATIDGDGQNDPKYLPLLLGLLQQSAGNVAMAAGQRLKRTDSRFKRYGSRLANYLRAGLLRDGARDSGCGMKVVRAEIFQRLPYFDGWHRFMPALIRREGYDIRFLDISDRPRLSGRSNYGIFDRLWLAAFDLFGVWWLIHRRKVIAAIDDGSKDVN